MRHHTIAIAIAVTGCAAPPMGLGAGAHRRAGDHAIAGSVGVGAAPGRQMVQVDGSMTHRYSDRFALEFGGTLTEVGVERMDDALIALGVLPYVRPRWRFGRVSFAVAGSAFAASGGETGAVGGFVDGQIGVGGDRWSIYAGGYGLGYVEGLGPSVGALQARVGAEVMVPVRGGRVGIALEAYAQTDRLQPAEEPAGTTSRFAGGGVKLRFERGRDIVAGCGKRGLPSCSRHARDRRRPRRARPTIRSRRAGARPTTARRRRAS